MNTYPLQEVLAKWIRGDLTPEQAIGQMLQHMVQQEQQVRQMERTLTTLAADTPAAPSPPIQPKRKGLP